jgi:hypothetical protein
MKPIVCAFIAFLTTLLRSRLSLQIEIVALRHQLAVYERSARRPRIHPGDRISLVSNSALLVQVARRPDVRSAGYS